MMMDDYYTITELVPSAPCVGGHDFRYAIVGRDGVVVAQAGYPAALRTRCRQLNEAFCAGVERGRRWHSADANDD